MKIFTNYLSSPGFIQFPERATTVYTIYIEGNLFEVVLSTWPTVTNIFLDIVSICEMKMEVSTTNNLRSSCTYMVNKFSWAVQICTTHYHLSLLLISFRCCKVYYWFYSRKFHVMNVTIVIVVCIVCGAAQDIDIWKATNLRAVTYSEGIEEYYDSLRQSQSEFQSVRENH